MELVVYGAAGPSGEERTLAYRLLAAALECECGLTELPPIERAPGGKPFFPSHPRIQFNLSHSRGGAVCALSDSPVGVDVELLRAAPKRLAGGMDDETFFRMWTAKEATVKQRGQGIYSFFISRQEPDPRCRFLENFLPGYIVAVCPAEGPVRTVNLTETFSRASRKSQP